MLPKEPRLLIVSDPPAAAPQGTTSVTWKAFAEDVWRHLRDRQCLVLAAPYPPAEGAPYRDPEFSRWSSEPGKSIVLLLPVQAGVMYDVDERKRQAWGQADLGSAEKAALSEIAGSGAELEGTEEDVAWTTGQQWPEGLWAGALSSVAIGMVLHPGKPGQGRRPLLPLLRPDRWPEGSGLLLAGRLEETRVLIAPTHSWRDPSEKSTALGLDGSPLQETEAVEGLVSAARWFHLTPASQIRALSKTGHFCDCPVARRHERGCRRPKPGVWPKLKLNRKTGRGRLSILGLGELDLSPLRAAVVKELELAGKKGVSDANLKARVTERVVAVGEPEPRGRFSKPDDWISQIKRAMENDPELRVCREVTSWVLPRYTTATMYHFRRSWPPKQ